MAPNPNPSNPTAAEKAAAEKAAAENAAAEQAAAEKAAAEKSDKPVALKKPKVLAESDTHRVLTDNVRVWKEEK